ncbi:hypothetical protein [Pseudoalteromonas luteoviolacea]|uniref:Uncharacterized protein n=1 Tax=Pseudoalteromonas luteoviolacea NCIMB 1942 TaxID=1365253 RepID=A0A161YA17_9GAMM|nr:hypothetical protein [Pseudoalteromonas luteoviolacea]KZN53435.1 hypothetical protein N482_24945 [Pseudoalteromonas luteoviolacea NCIMB 1942]
MSNEHTTITENLANVATRANELCNTVDSQIANINTTLTLEQQKLATKITEFETKVNSFIESDFKREIPFFRLTKNQELKVNGQLTVGSIGIPDGFTSRVEQYHCEIVAFSQHGVESSQKHPEIQKMWRDLKNIDAPKWSTPDFAIMRIRPKEGVEYPDTLAGGFSIYQGEIPLNGDASHGIWIKAEQGRVAFTSSFTGIIPADNTWYERIVYASDHDGGTSHTNGPHIYLEKGASCLIALPGIVAGRVPAGRWGYFERPVFEREQ